MWVAQQPCATGSPAQQWRMTLHDGQVTLTDRSGSYALTVSNRPYYGTWLLDLQQADGRPAQTWTARQTG
ncbi:RICIN domain-containing protein [Streptomyces tanashiensis]